MPVLRPRRDHSKLAVIDDVWAAIGSSNLDRRSVVFNNEVDAAIIGEDTATQIEALLQIDFAASALVSLQAWKRRAFDERFEELKAHLWEYWDVAVWAPRKLIHRRVGQIVRLADPIRFGLR